MGVQKYQTCPHCGRELKRTRENFKGSVNKETGKGKKNIMKYVENVKNSQNMINIGMEIN